MTLKEARAFVAIYQEKLGLGQWRVDVRYGKPHEIPDDTAGQIQWSIEFSTAIMLLNKKEVDLEHTIIHELIHLVLEGHKPCNGSNNPHYERGINRIAEAILGRPCILG